MASARKDICNPVAWARISIQARRNRKAAELCRLTAKRQSRAVAGPAPSQIPIHTSRLGYMIAATFASPYERVGAEFIDNPFSAIPIMPGAKIPGDAKRQMAPNVRLAALLERSPTQIEVGIPGKWGTPACVSCWAEPTTRPTTSLPSTSKHRRAHHRRHSQRPTG